METSRDPFLSFIQKKEKLASHTEAPESRKMQWLESLNRLYSQIEEWLVPYLKDGQVSIDRSSAQLREQRLGSYSAPMLRIKIVDETVDVIPRGTYIVGAFGRVDLVSRKRNRQRIIEDRWNEWHFAVESSENIPLNADTFKRRLMHMAR